MTHTSENRISLCWKMLREKNDRALIPYITPEFPIPHCTVPLLKALDLAGATMIEVGVPFSDPLADGPTIQHSSQIAIDNGASIRTIFDAVIEFRKGSQLPILLMGYTNPILHYGVKEFFADANEAGVDGMIIPDLPPEEAGEFQSAAKQKNISLVFLIAPTTTADRIQLLDQSSTHFSYCVSITGVTGVKHDFSTDSRFQEFMRMMKQNAKKPFVVGFSIQSDEDVCRVWKVADGVVVGSALIRAIESKKTINEIADAAGAFLRSIRPNNRAKE